MPLSAPILVLLVLLSCLAIEKKIRVLIVNIFAMWDLQNLLHFRSCAFQGKSGHVQVKAPWGEGAALLSSHCGPPAFGGSEAARGPVAASSFGV